jgi:DNA-binding SARP family transcriptional activator
LLAGEWALEYLSDAEELFALKGACFIIANDSLSLINYAFHGEAALEFSPLLKKYLVADANALNKTLSTYKRLRRKVYNAAIAYRQENPDPFRRNLPQEVSHGIETEQDTKIPMLYVSLFGGTEISIGGKKIDLSSVTRKKALTLLAMLVLNRGNVVSRRTIADELWPDGGVDSFKTNFYTIWSQLKAILKVDGRCPYLLRTKDGCSINLDYVDSDVFHYDGLCRTLLFGSDKSYTWERLYDEVSNRYSSELLPHEESNEFIKSTRLKYKTQIVDGLIATSTRLNALNESMGALWFAREALGRDNLREDVYIALMEAQIASNQRSAAVDTYFMCRRTLCDKLGIDPSLKMVSLYNSVIQDEEVFV